MEGLHIITTGDVNLKDVVENAKEFGEGISHQHVKYEEFACGETKVQLPESVRRKKVLIVGDLSGKIGKNNITFSDKVVQLLLVKDAAETRGASSVEVITPQGFDLPFMKEYDREGTIIGVDPIGSLDKSTNRGDEEIKPNDNTSGESRIDLDSNIKSIIKNHNHPEEKVHLIGTQDTKILTLSIISQLEGILGANVSYEIHDYKRDEGGRPSINLEQDTYGKQVYVVSDLNGSQEAEDVIGITYNERLLQSLYIQHAAWKRGAENINACYTSGVYGRQDRIVHGGENEEPKREPVSAKLFDDIIRKNNAYRIGIDEHNPASIASKKLIDHETGGLMKQILENENDRDNITLCPMDIGGGKKIQKIAKDLKLPYLDVSKIRDTTTSNKVDEIRVIGDIEGRDIWIHDDILDTGGSLIKLLEKVQEGNPRSINIVITHGLFNNDAIEKLTKAHKAGVFDKIYVTNTVIRDDLPDFVKVKDASPVFANTIGSLATPEKSVDHKHAVWERQHKVAA